MSGFLKALAKKAINFVNKEDMEKKALAFFSSLAPPLKDGEVMHSIVVLQSDEGDNAKLIFNVAVLKEGLDENGNKSLILARTIKQISFANLLDNIIDATKEE